MKLELYKTTMTIMKMDGSLVRLYLVNKTVRMLINFGFVG